MPLIIERKVDRLAVSITAVTTSNTAADLHAAIGKLDAVLNAIQAEDYRPSQGDALAALELATMLAEASASGDCCPIGSDRLASLIWVGHGRLKRMGL